MGNVGLRLVVVVVADKVLCCIVGEEPFELVVELGGKGLVVRDHQCWPVHSLNHLGHGEGLAATGHPKQGLVGHTCPQVLNDLLNGLRLVTCGLKRRLHLEHVAHGEG